MSLMHVQDEHPWRPIARWAFFAVVAALPFFGGMLLLFIVPQLVTSIFVKYIAYVLGCLFLLFVALVAVGFALDTLHCRRK